MKNTITNAATAREFCSDWIRNGSPTAARRHIGYALEGLKRVLAIETTYRWHSDDTRAAIAVLEANLVEATRCERVRDDRLTWVSYCKQWAEIGATMSRGIEV